MKPFLYSMIAISLVGCLQVVEEQLEDDDGGRSRNDGGLGGGGGTSGKGGGQGGGIGGGLGGGIGGGQGGGIGGGIGGGVGGGTGGGGGSMPSGDGGVSPGCNIGNCNGCCVQNFCVDTQLQSVFGCGSKGQACSVCDRRELCIQGVCTPDLNTTVDGGISSPCTFDSQCTKLTPTTFCLRERLAGSPTGWTGGYCTAECESTGCPVGSTCFRAPDAGVLPVCLALCGAPRTGRSSCRASYVCEVSGTGLDGVCIPRCDNAGFTCPGNRLCDARTGYCTGR